MRLLCLGNTQAAAAVRSFDLIRDFSFGGHLGQAITLDLGLSYAPVWVWTAPTCYNTQGSTKMDWCEKDALGQAACRETQQAFDQAIADQDVEASWRLFNEAAEAYLAARTVDCSEQGGTGRGQPPRFVQRPLAALVRDPDAGAEARRIILCGTLERQLTAYAKRACRCGNNGFGYLDFGHVDAAWANIQFGVSRTSLQCKLWEVWLGSPCCHCGFRARRPDQVGSRTAQGEGQDLQGSGLEAQSFQRVVLRQS